MQVMLNQIKQDSKVRVQDIVANGQLESTKLEQEKNALITKLHSEATATAAQFEAEADKYEATKISQAELDATRNKSQAELSMAKAEGVAAPYVEARKQFETRQKQMQVWTALAANEDLVVSGEANEELNTIILCDAILGNQEGAGTKSQVLAEMLVMQRGSKVMLNLGGEYGGASSSGN